MTNRPNRSALGPVPAVLASVLLALNAIAASAQQLPPTAPRPPERPEIGMTPTLPELPKVAPTPGPPPELATPKPGPKPMEKAAKPEPAGTPLPAEPVKSNAELACRKALGDIGAVFKEAQIPAPTNGCALPFPVELSAFAPKTEVRASVTVNCAMALAASDFVQAVVQPAAKEILGSPVASITQASGYVCRNRNGTGKLSEHAFGNALDIASFTLATGEVVAVEPSPPAKHAQFLKRVRDAACGPFKTVLGPGSNADHELHFHFDLAQRRNGGTYCK